MANLIETPIMATDVTVVVVLADGTSMDEAFDPEVKAEDVKRVIRELYYLEGGTLKKKLSGSSDTFKIVMHDEEKLSANYEYMFVGGNSGIVSNSV